MDNALTRLVAWQQGGKGRSVILSTTDNGWHCFLRQGNVTNFAGSADTPEAVIDAAMGAFEEWERGTR